MQIEEIVGGHLVLAVAVLVGVVVISILMVLAVFAFKGRRDRAEARSTRVRTALRQALEAGGTGRLRPLIQELATKRPEEQQDLLAVLTATRTQPWWTTSTTRLLREELERQKFRRVLKRQLHHRHPERRGTAALLGANPACRLPATVIAPLLGDRNSTVRLAAAAALERVATDQAAHALIDALEQRVLPDPRIIERLGHSWAVPACRSRLRATAASTPAHVRGALARALALAGDPQAVPDLVWLLDVGTAEEQIQAMRGLAACAVRAGDAERSLVVAAARANLQTQNGPLTLMSCIALDETGDTTDISRFARLLTHRDWHVRRAAARALRDQGQAGMQILVMMASGPDRYAAERASEELALAGLTLAGGSGGA